MRIGIDARAGERRRIHGKKGSMRCVRTARAAVLSLFETFDIALTPKKKGFSRGSTPLTPSRAVYLTLVPA